MTTDPPQVLLVGDLHGNTNHLRHLIDIADREQCSYLFQLGDFGYWPHTPDGRAYLRDCEKFAARAGQTIWWLDGNHDRSSLIDLAVTDNEGFVIVSDHVRYAPRGHRWTWNGVRFIALGGAYSVDKQWRLQAEQAKASAAAEKRARYGYGKPVEAAGTLWFPEEELSDAELAAALTDPTPVDVMLTHDKPRASNPAWNRKDIPECWPNQDRIQAAVRALRPALLVHGHLHYPYTDRIRSGDDSWTTVIGLDADPAAAAAERRNYDKKDSWEVLTLEAHSLNKGAMPQIVNRDGETS